MKILTIAATSFFSDRGCHIRIYNEVKYLQKLGHKIRILGYDKGRDIENLDIKRISKTIFYKKKSPGFSWMKIWVDLKLFFLVRKEIKKFQPDVIHAHLYEGIAVGYLAKKIAFRKIPIIGDIQGDLEKEFEGYNKKNIIAKKIFVAFSKKVINWCDWVFVSSKNALNSVNKIYKFPEKVSIIKDGVDLELFQDAAQVRNEIEREIEKVKNWKNKNKVLIYTGGLDDSKGTGELITEFKNISSDWKLILFGDGQDKNKYKTYIEDSNLMDKIFLTKHHGYFDLPFYLELADAGVDPKKNSSEGSGKLVNYMVVGLPVICFENNFNRDFLKEKGIYLQDINELKEKLILLENNNNDWEYESLNHLDGKEEMKKLELIFKKLV